MDIKDKKYLKYKFKYQKIKKIFDGDLKLKEMEDIINKYYGNANMIDNITIDMIGGSNQTNDDLEKALTLIKALCDETENINNIELLTILRNPTYPNYEENLENIKIIRDFFKNINNISDLRNKGTNNIVTYINRQITSDHKEILGVDFVKMIRLSRAGNNLKEKETILKNIQKLDGDQFDQLKKLDNNDIEYILNKRNTDDSYNILLEKLKDPINNIEYFNNEKTKNFINTITTTVKDNIKATITSAEEGKTERENEYKKQAAIFRAEQDAKNKTKREQLDAEQKKAEKKAEDEERKKAEPRLEAQKKAEEESQQQETKQKKAEDEARKKAEEEEQKKAEEEERKKAEDEARKKAEEEAQQQETEQKKAEEEARKKAEEETQQQETEQKKAEEEARKKAETTNKIIDADDDDDDDDDDDEDDDDDDDNNNSKARRKKPIKNKLKEYENDNSILFENKSKLTARLKLINRENINLPELNSIGNGLISQITNTVSNYYKKYGESKNTTIFNKLLNDVKNIDSELVETYDALITDITRKLGIKGDAKKKFTNSFNKLKRSLFELQIKLLFSKMKEIQSIIKTDLPEDVSEDFNSLIDIVTRKIDTMSEFIDAKEGNIVKLTEDNLTLNDLNKVSKKVDEVIENKSDQSGGKDEKINLDLDSESSKQNLYSENQLNKHDNIKLNNTELNDIDNIILSLINQHGGFLSPCPRENTTIKDIRRNFLNKINKINKKAHQKVINMILSSYNYINKTNVRKIDDIHDKVTTKILCHVSNKLHLEIGTPKKFEIDEKDLLKIKDNDDVDNDDVDNDDDGFDLVKHYIEFLKSVASTAIAKPDEIISVTDYNTFIKYLNSKNKEIINDIFKDYTYQQLIDQDDNTEKIINKLKLYKKSKSKKKYDDDDEDDGVDLVKHYIEFLKSVASTAIAKPDEIISVTDYNTFINNLNSKNKEIINDIFKDYTYQQLIDQDANTEKIINKLKQSTSSNIKKKKNTSKSKSTTKSNSTTKTNIESTNKKESLNKDEIKTLNISNIENEYISSFPDGGLVVAIALTPEQHTIDKEKFINMINAKEIFSSSLKNKLINIIESSNTLQDYRNNID